VAIGMVIKLVIRLAGYVARMETFKMHARF